MVNTVYNAAISGLQAASLKLREVPIMLLMQIPMGIRGSKSRHRLAPMALK